MIHPLSQGEHLESLPHLPGQGQALDGLGLKRPFPGSGGGPRGGQEALQSTGDEKGALGGVGAAVETRGEAGVGDGGKINAGGDVL